MEHYYMLQGMKKEFSHVTESEENPQLAKRWRLKFISGLLVFLGLVFLFVSYSNSLDVEDYFSDSSKFSNQTSLFLNLIGIILFLIGAGLITNMAYKNMILKYATKRYLPFLIVSLVAFITLLLWQTLLFQKNKQLRRIIRLETDSTGNLISSNLNNRIYSLMRMAKRWEMEGGTPEDEWKNDATAQFEQQGGYQSIQWLDNNFIVKWIVPLKGNEAALNLKANFEPTREHALLLAKNENIITISPPLELIQKGKGSLIYVPVYKNKQFDGFIIAVVRFKDLFDVIFQSGIAPGYNLAIYQENQLIYERDIADQQARLKWTTTLSVPIRNVTWRIEVWPSEALLKLEKSSVPLIILVSGLILAILLGVLIRLAQLAQLRLNETELANIALQKEMLERERAEQEKMKLQTILVQNQKIQAIGTLAGGIAHDFNNMLYAILGYVGMAKDDVPAESHTYANLVKVIEVGQRAQELVNQILLFSRQQQTVYQKISLHKVLESTLSLLGPRLASRVDLEIIDHLANHDCVFGNHTQLQQVLVNLINNAVDAMNGEGKIQIELAEVKADNALVKQYPQLKLIDYCLITVKDSGMGMDAATLERIFEPFFTTKEVGKGTGLGMSIVHGIIIDHKGEILVTSELGKGTTFYIYLPTWAVTNGTS